MRGKTKSNKQTSKQRTSRLAKADKKGRSSATDERIDCSEERGRNDPAWYAQTPELLRDAASIPFSNAAGVRTTFQYRLPLVGNGDTFAEGYFVSPGIMTLKLVPMPGYATSPTSPLNVAAVSLYSFIRHANSGSANYDAPDLMLYCLSMGQVYAYINWLMRIYGSMFVYANMNRYLPKGLLLAQEVDFDDVNQNLASFRYGINVLIHQASSMAVPATLTYFQRLAFLFSNIYAEGESVKSQLYMYTPGGFMEYQEATASTGGQCVYVPLPTQNNHKLTVNELLQFGQNLLSKVLASEDLGIMSGDILKAYGTEGVLKLQPIPEMYQVMPVTNLEVLEQMQNANFVSRVDTAKVYQNVDLNCLMSEFTVKTPKTPSTQFSSPLINIPQDHVLTTILTEPNPGDVIERTRMMLSIRSVTDDETDYTFTIDGCSEVATDCSFWTINPVANPQQYMELIRTPVPQSLLVNDEFAPLSTNYGNSIINTHCIAENFKFHPILYYFMQNATGTSNSFYNFAIDLDNYALVSKNTLDRMNEAALLSMFNVNSIAKAY